MQKAYITFATIVSWEKATQAAIDKNPDDYVDGVYRRKEAVRSRWADHVSVIA